MVLYCVYRGWKFTQDRARIELDSIREAIGFEVTDSGGVGVFGAYRETESYDYIIYKK